MRKRTRFCEETADRVIRQLPGTRDSELISDDLAGKEILEALKRRSNFPETLPLEVRTPYISATAA